MKKTATIETVQAQKAASRYEHVKREMSQIEKIIGYDDIDTGIAYRKDTGKLVEYIIPQSSVLVTEHPEIEVTEITLADCLEYVEKMQFAEIRLNTCAQIGEAFPRWISELRAAIK